MNEVTLRALLFLILILFSTLTKSAEAPNLEWKKNYQTHQELTVKYFQKLARIEQNIIGVELITAAESDLFIGSQWGHVMVRFVHADGKIEKDLVVSFEADVNTPTLSIAKGIYGGYKTIPVIRPLLDVWERYVRNEGRSLVRTIIPTDAVIRGKMINILGSYLENPKLLGKYRFFSNNCADGVAEFLKDSNFNYDLAGIAIPKNFNEYLDRSLINLYPSLTINGTQPIFEKAIRALEISREQFLSGTGYPTDSYERLMTHLSIKEIAVIYQEIVLLPYELSRKLAKDLRSSQIKESDYLGITYIPSELYEVCDDEICTELASEVAVTIFGASSLLKKYRALKRIKENYSIEKTEENNFLKIKQKNQVAIIHFELWINELKNKTAELFNLNNNSQGEFK